MLRRELIIKRKKKDLKCIKLAFLFKYICIKKTFTFGLKFKMDEKDEERWRWTKKNLHFIAVNKLPPSIIPSVVPSIIPTAIIPAVIRTMVVWTRICTVNYSRGVLVAVAPSRVVPTTKKKCFFFSTVLVQKVLWCYPWYPDSAVSWTSDFSSTGFVSFGKA